MNKYSYALLLFFLALNALFMPMAVADCFLNNDDCSSKHVLAVFAHPDDETWINGTLAMIAQQGQEVTVVYAASGDRGSDRSGRGLSGSDLAMERELEARRALQALNISTKPIFLRLGDSTLKDRIVDLSVRLDSIMQETAANLVISFGPGGMTGHSDHIAVARATALAFERSKYASMLLSIAISEKRAQGLAAIAAKHGVQNYMPTERVAEEAEIIEVKLANFITQRQSSPKAHVTQFTDVLLNAWDEFVLTYRDEEVVISRKKLLREGEVKE